MNDNMKAFWLGLFIVVALGLSAWLILFLKPNVGDGGVKLVVRFSNIDKVSQGTLVTFGGRQVGIVKEIKEIQDPRKAPADAFGNLYIYELLLEVDSSVKIFVYDEIIYATSGLLGEKSIAIIPKAPPAGAPLPHEVTHEILYARSTDRFEQTLNKFVGVADTIQDTLEEINIFIETNNQDFHLALQSLTAVAQEVQMFMHSTQETSLVNKAAQAMAQAHDFFSSIKQNHLFERLGNSFDSLNEAASRFYSGEGTIARLTSSDSLYIQLTTILCQLQTTLSDINNFGLLYQFDRKWQRLNRFRRSCTEIPIPEYCQK